MGNQLERALFHVKNAIQLLDEVDAPPEIAAHLDLGRHMIEKLLTGRNGRLDSSANMD